MECLIPISRTNISHILVWCKATMLPLSAHLSSVAMESQRGQKAQGVTAGAQSHGKWQITTLMSAIHHLFPLFSLHFSHSHSFFPLSSNFSSKLHDYHEFHYNKPACGPWWLKWRNKSPETTENKCPSKCLNSCQGKWEEQRERKRRSWFQTWRFFIILPHHCTTALVSDLQKSHCITIKPEKYLPVSPHHCQTYTCLTV